MRTYSLLVLTDLSRSRTGRTTLGVPIAVTPKNVRIKHEVTSSLRRVVSFLSAITAV
ncbi:hypothetical protein PRSM4_200 [Prochlorococcus phage P-RSM4]|uniref:Uncharacterized protein n=1 Tax=Prochlorococcus phage P-RSM4 TaxID=444862 RepID=E3SM85_9CAUD|nr:hypothetical protein PRSM4_200 [Prochlorococcus phage P-RSM4]ADO98583.1 hypothetical protein PRSM4_200 [Prochlorococcus phage P-RSM4]